jgi:hypothetical protein
VPDDVIPDEGRDVQCSNCGKTWFQEKYTEDSPEALAAEAEAPKDTVWHPEVDSDVASGPSVNAGAAPGESTPPTPPKRRELDPAVADILREEAELEARTRTAEAAETNVFEDQPDLGLQEPEDEATKRAQQAKERMRKLRGDTPDPSIAAAATGAVVAQRPQSRSDMLPDVDEINQSLRASTERPDISSVQADLEDEEETGGGFGRGFILAILLFAIAAALYVFAPQLSENIAALEEPLATYVSYVDQGRAWLDGMVAQLMALAAEVRPANRQRLCSMLQFQRSAR